MTAHYHNQVLQKLKKNKTKKKNTKRPRLQKKIAKETINETSNETLCHTIDFRQIVVKKQEEGQGSVLLENTVCIDEVNTLDVDCHTLSHRGNLASIILVHLYVTRAACHSKELA